jgi:hypothetical protein
MMAARIFKDLSVQVPDDFGKYLEYRGATDILSFQQLFGSKNRYHYLLAD